MVLGLQHGNSHSECPLLDSPGIGCMIRPLCNHHFDRSLTYVPQIANMEEAFDAQPSLGGLERWLNYQSRCFGDKGDVEDITEGSFL